MRKKEFYHHFFGILFLVFGLIFTTSVFFLPAAKAETKQMEQAGKALDGTLIKTSKSGAESASTDDQVIKEVAGHIDAALERETADTNHLIDGFVANEVSEYLPEDVVEVMRMEVFGNTVWQLVCSLVLLLLTLLLRNLIIKIIFEYVLKLIKRSRFEFDKKLLEAMRKPLSVFLLLLGFFIALMVLSMSDGMRLFIENIYRGLIVLMVVWALLRAVDALVDVMISRDAERYKSIHGFIPLIRKTVKIFIGIVGVVMVIDNLGFNVGGILATLGIGGAALAFASKDTVANGFGTLMIMLDRPFKVGDWIIVGDKVDGDVEEIGLRSTKVRTWPKTVLSIPNGVLANEYINNWSRMPKRRVKQIINIAHGATANDMDALVEDIREILRIDDGVDQEFVLVNFTDITSESLEILVYYFTISVKWLEYMDVRQRVNLKMMRAVEERGLKIAFLEQALELEYNKNVEEGEKMPWDERWELEAKSNPQGAYSRRSSSGIPQLPGDSGPTMPL